MAPQTFLIDTDTASDDAVALIMALGADLAGIDVRVAAITTVAGNVPVAQATQNALYVAELCQSEAPFSRAPPSLSGANTCTQSGFTGATDWAAMAIPHPPKSATPAHAVDAILACVSMKIPALLWSPSVRSQT